MSGSNTPKSIFEGTALVITANFLGAAVGFATSALIARRLDVGEFGNFSLILAVFGVIILFAVLGVGTEASRLIAKFRAAGDQKKASSVLKSASELTLVTALGAALLLFSSAGLLSGIFQKDLAGGLRIASLMLVFAGFMALLLSFLQGFQRFFSHSFLVSFNNVAKLAAVLLLLRFGANGALYGILAAYIATVLAGILLLGRDAAFLRAKPYSHTELLLQGIPLFTFSLFVFLGGRASMYLLGLVSGSEELGIYSGALMFSQAFFMLPDAIATVLLPALSGMYGQDGRFSAFLRYSAKLGSILAFPVLIGIGIFAPQIIGALLGKSYAQSAGVLRIMILTGMAYFFYSLLSTTILASGRQKLLVRVSIAGFAAILLSGLFLVPRYGAYGAAVADVIGYSVMGIVAMLSVRKLVQFPLPAGLPAVALSNLLFGLFLWYGQGMATGLLGHLSILFFGAVAYIFSIKLTGAISPEEAAILKNLLVVYQKKKDSPATVPSLPGFK